MQEEAFDKSYELFSKSPLFLGLKQEDIKALFSLSQEVKIEKGDTLIQEGEKADELYIVLAGSLQILKFDPQIKESHLIDVLSPGDTVGEIAFLDHGLRTATVQALEPSSLRSLKIEKLKEYIDRSPNMCQILYRLSASICRKLRHTNDIAVQALRNKVEEYKTRSIMGLFLISIITALSIFTFTLPSLYHLQQILPNSTYITAPLTLFTGFFVYILSYTFDIPASEMGITTKNWEKSLFEGALFTLIIWIPIGLLFKWILLNYFPQYNGRPLFDPFALIHDPKDKTWHYWIGLNCLYVFFIVPIQELISRGCLQGLLEKFLIGKHRVLFSILMSNLLFSSVHVFFSDALAILVFIAGCYMGILFSRTHNLLGCWLAHSIIGVFFLSIIGISGALFE